MSNFNTNKINGSTLEADEWNQLQDLKNLVSTSGINPDTSLLNQIPQAVSNYVAIASFYTDNGIANAYNLTPINNFKSPTQYITGMLVRFRTANPNTGASTVNVASLGVKNIKKADGITDLVAGDIPSGADIEFRYDGTNFLLNSVVSASATTQGVTYLLPNRNIIINGAMAIDQRNAGASQTITAGSVLAYTVDRWYAYCTGANVIGQRVVGTAPNQFNYRFTGASSVSKIGFAQRIEASNSQHLAGKTATLSVDLANSLLTTITWTAWYANTADTFGTLASPTRTQIATGTFAVNSTLTRYATSISIPSSATTGIEIELSVDSQTSGTWTIGRVQLEDTPEQTTFEYRGIQQELNLCQRYFQKTMNLDTAVGFNVGTTGAIYYRSNSPIGNTNFCVIWNFATRMRTNASIALYNPSAGNTKWGQIGSASEYDSFVESTDETKATIAYIGGLAPGYQLFVIHATASAEL
jgi:hypothetical protein